MGDYAVRRSRLALWVAYLLAEGILAALLAGMLVIWREAPSYLDWPVAIASWLAAAGFFHFFLFMGSFYRVQVRGEEIEYHAFLRRTRRMNFSDIQRVEPTGMDVKIIGHNNKKLFYVKLSDRNFERFMADVAAHTGG